MIKNLKPKLAEAGKIKIGGLGPARKSARGTVFRPPTKFDHFLITNTSRDDNGDLIVDKNLMDAIEKDSHGKIRSIPIVLHSDDIDCVFPTSYALYSGKKCACRGDGETATRREMKEKQFTGNEKTVDCPCDYLNSNEGPKCKPNGKLYCSIAAPGAAVAGAVHIWRTTSIISIEQLIGSLEQIKTICGTLRGIPLWLIVKPVTVEPPGSGPITVFCCHVELRAADVGEIQRKALKAAETRRILGADDAQYRKMLTDPGAGESDVDQAEIEAEFYTDETPDEPQDPKAPADADGVKAALAKQEEEPKPAPNQYDPDGDLFGGSNG